MLIIGGRMPDFQKVVSLLSNELLSLLEDEKCATFDVFLHSYVYKVA